MRLLAVLLVAFVASPFAGGAPVLLHGPVESPADAPRDAATAATATPATPAATLAPSGSAARPPPASFSVAPLPKTPPVTLPETLADADLVLLLAHHAGLPAARVPLQPPPPDATVASLVLDLARRSGVPHPAAADVEAYARLDPRVAGPVLTLLAAIAQAWDLRDAALADVPPHDQRALARLVLEGRHETPEGLALAEPVNRTQLVQAAILLLDAAEALALPQLQAAAEQGAWPAEPLADPLGILRIGGTGDDVESADRLLQIDARGNDTYHNNAGGTTFLADVSPETPDYPIALSIDLSGHDTYRFEPARYALGSGFLGVGVHLDLEGDDVYECPRFCQGVGTTGGIGIHRDFEGDDVRWAGANSLGYGALIGVVRDDQGNDTYNTGTLSGGYGFNPVGYGVLWDRAGQDRYLTILQVVKWRYGWGEQGGHGWLVDEGADVDEYEVASLGGRACDGCRWTQGSGWQGGRVHGHGNDNSGGLAALLVQQDDPLHVQ